MANYYLNIIFLNRFIFQLMSLKCLNNFLNTKKSLVLLVNVNHVPNASKSKKKNSKWSINYCIRNQLFCFTKKINILLAGLSHFGLLHSLNQNKKERKKTRLLVVTHALRLVIIKAYLRRPKSRATFSMSSL